MKLYKFRSLATDNKQKSWVPQIIKTNQFWCSSFHEMNDPMEGVYFSDGSNQIDEVLSQKNRRKICSFSGVSAFRKPCMWGYYANGFKGIAIEIEVDPQEIEKVNYVKETPLTSEVNEILTTKLNSWRHENEYRFIKVSDENHNKIGKITKVYFGDPYAGLTNSDSISDLNEKIRKYRMRREELESLLEEKNIPYAYVEVIENIVKEKQIDRQ